MAQNNNINNNTSPFSDKSLIDALEQELLNASTLAKRTSPSALSSAVAALRSSSELLKETDLAHARLALFSDSSSRAIGIQWLRKQVVNGNGSEGGGGGGGGKQEKEGVSSSVTSGGTDQGDNSSGLVSPSTKMRSEFSLWLAVGLIEDGQYSASRSVLSTAILADPGNERLGAMLELYKSKVRKEGPAGLTLVVVGTVAVILVSAIAWWYAKRGGGSGGGMKRRR